MLLGLVQLLSALREQIAVLDKQIPAGTGATNAVGG